MVAPAGGLDQARIELAAERLREEGFKVIVPKDLFRKRGYLAGTDRQRADEMMRAFLDPQVDAIFCGTGGYGVTRMLDLLDWDLIAKHPKVFIGFSDITAMHLALDKKANLVTFHSPNPQWGLGSEDNLAPFSAKYFWRNLMADQNRGAVGFTYEQPQEVGPLKAIAGGKASGRLTGGNLSLVATLMGTPYEIQTDGRILFLEDVHEAPYRIDRMLSQLKLAGKLDRPAGVILGQYRDCSPEEGDSGLTLDQVFADYFADAPYPVVSNFPAGHTTLNATLPLGSRAEINADALTIRVLENPVSSE
jgi:muramoyltetrapeptide carboxypeptidase